EAVHLSFKGMRDSVVFTNKRLITVNVQGMTGKKRDYSSLPHSKVQAWSIETAGRFDLDAELELWFSGLGKVRLDFKGQVDIRSIGRSSVHTSSVNALEQRKRRQCARPGLRLLHCFNDSRI